ncbi:hypothetical protein [Dysgonomonas termitidis]|uniref:Uncharacterized protein n=1 Tax=Dysgonomonas termitidis TaxID=1516126 RepID=A0ABV9KXB4_9BACT
MLESKLVSWYQVLGEQSLDQDKLNSRIEVLEEIYKNEKLDFLLSCSRYYLLNKTNEEFLTKFIKYFDSKSPIYTIESKETEQRILAGAILYNSVVLKNRRDYKVCIGLVFDTLTFSTNLEYLNKSIVDEVKSTLTETILNNREIESVSNLRSEKEVNETISKVISAFNKLNKNQQVLGDELNCYGWLISDIYAGDQQKYEGRNKVELALIFGKELSDCTTINLPMAKVDVLIEKKYQICKIDVTETKILFNNFVNATLDFNNLHISDAANLYCPILSALKSLADTEQKDSFLKLIKDQFRVNFELELTISSYAKEVYNECLLYKLLNNA